MKYTYDLCIVGAGLVGSAAARHASVTPGLKLCLIGPQEPKERVNVTHQEIYGAHYDYGRVTRTTDLDPVWAHISKQSQIRYRELEARSGIRFYSDVGTLFISDSTTLERFQKIAADQVKIQSHSDLLQNYPYLKFDGKDTGLLNFVGGVVNPRAQTDAAIMVASKNGCDIIRDIVCHVNKENESNGAIMKLKTEGGKTIYSKKVLLATNVFTGARHLLPDIKVKFKATPQTVVLAEVDPKDLEQLRYMPSVIYWGQGSPSWYQEYPKTTDGLVRFYMLPPIPYSDGKHYVKIGHSDTILKRSLCPEEISSWHCSGGDPWLVDHLTKLVKSLFSGIEFKSFRSDACVTMVTPTGRPYIEKIHDSLGVAIGGNGRAAKCSDEIGHIAASMMTSSTWGYKLPQDSFKVVFENDIDSEKTVVKSKI